MPQGACAIQCPSNLATVRQTLQQAFKEMKQTNVEVDCSRAYTSRCVPCAKTYSTSEGRPLLIHDEESRRPVKLDKIPAVNVVFLRSESYDCVVAELAEALFPYPAWRDGATYDLATCDGALIKAGTKFEDFPFNLSSSKSKKQLWLIRHDQSDSDVVLPTLDLTRSDAGVNDMPYFDHGRTVVQEIRSADVPPVRTGRLSTAAGVFGDLHGRSFQEMYDATKAVSRQDSPWPR
uniref:Uncharacterized protein n=1 Tax=Spongospora subterranea TaxID=70186 RepID=A0A0H5QZY7_9EUKA|eukprot:CRZ07465.1 hypothetical protein [Spongospora subterranea]